MDRESAPTMPGWRIHRCLGRGRSGDVFLARRDEGTWAAVRRLAARPANHRGGDHLVGVHDVVETDHGWAAVLDLVEGGTLHHHLEARGRLTVGELLTVLLPLAQAAQQLHAAGLVHCVLDPRHVLLSRVGRPMLTDLAGAHAHPARPSLPRPADDVLGLGMIGWRALAGAEAAHPWERPPLATLVGPVDPVVVDVVQACADPDPQQRPSAADVTAELGACGRAEPLFASLTDDPAQRVTRRIPARFGTRGAAGDHRSSRR